MSEPKLKEFPYSYIVTADFSVSVVQPDTSPPQRGHAEPVPHTVPPTQPPSILPVADFTAAPLAGTAPLSVTFSNLSTNGTGYLWTFGDGTQTASANPLHNYLDAGTYTVILEADGVGGTDTKTRTNYILAAPGDIQFIFTSLTSIYLPTVTEALNVNIFNNDFLTSINLSSLTTCDVVQIYSNSLLTALNLSALTTVTSEAIIDFWGSTLDLHALVTIGPNGLSITGSFSTLLLSALVTAGPSVFAISSSALGSISLASFVPENGLTQDFSGCSLDQSSVDLILHRAVLNAGYVSGLIDLTGANSPPTTQTDVTTLTNRGVSVFTN